MEYKMQGFNCTNLEGPYTRESVKRFGLTLGNRSDLKIACPLQDIVEMLDGLGVTAVSGKLTVNLCHMHVDRPIHGAFELRLGHVSMKRQNELYNGV